MIDRTHNDDEHMSLVDIHPDLIRIGRTWPSLAWTSSHWFRPSIPSGPVRPPATAGFGVLAPAHGEHPAPPLSAWFRSDGFTGMT